MISEISEGGVFMKTVLITGASSGIGYELAKVYAGNNYNIVIVARRKERLEKLKKEIGSSISDKISVTLIEKDLGAENASRELFHYIKLEKIKIDTVINNAGFGIYGKFSDLTPEEIEKNNDLINLNIKALTELTKLYLDEFLKEKKGEILNVSSIAAFLPGPMMASYYASKAYVLSFTEAIREEVRGTDIKIGTLCPGPTATEFEKSSNADKGGLFSSLKVMTAEKVAEIAYKDFSKGKNIIVPGFLNKMAVFMVRFLPRKLMTVIAGKIQRKKVRLL